MDLFERYRHTYPYKIPENDRDLLEIDIMGELVSGKKELAMAAAIVFCIAHFFSQMVSGAELSRAIDLVFQIKGYIERASITTTTYGFHSQVILFIIISVLRPDLLTQP